MERTEVEAEQGDSHLGHVFDDSPHRQNELHFVSTGAALRFIREEMEKEDYRDYMDLVWEYHQRGYPRRQPRQQPNLKRLESCLCIKRKNREHQPGLPGRTVGSRCLRFFPS